MEKDCGSSVQQRNSHSHWQAPNLNCMSFMLDSGRQDFVPAYINQYPNMVAANGSLPGIAVADLPQFKMGQTNGARGWFYCLPRYRQASIPNPRVVSKEFPTSSHRGYDGVVGYGPDGASNAMLGSVQKRFLVFDQSGDQTSLFFSSPIASHVQHPSRGNSKPLVSSALCVGDISTEIELMNQGGPLIDAGFEDNEETGDKSEMHEDTEELNALLYSDDEYSDYDDEETSTGHSPSDLTGYDKKQDAEESGEEVASSAGPTKRKRLPEEEQYMSSLVDTASSGKPDESLDSKDDAESICAEGNTQGKTGCLPASKRFRRERIWETVSILRSIIPGGKGKDAVLVLDEAIQYLRSLKLKAKFLDVVL